MSTRSEIFGPDGKGRYHHWDGYPLGVGRTLWALYHGHFERDVRAMRKVLLEDHPAGWSTINGADWSLEPGFIDNINYTCAKCGEDHNLHYWQNLTSAQKKALGEWDPLKRGYLVKDHMPQRPEMPKPPQCYCHGAREEEADGRILGPEIGEEYAYVIEDAGLRVFASPKKLLGFFPWDEPEPTWSKLED